MRVGEGYEQDMEGLVLNQLDDERRYAVSIFSLMVRASLRHGTVVAALKRLMAQGLVQRVWDGNMRFGRYIYWRLPQTAVKP